MTTDNYLYHYTNINTLKLILKNKTIRFKSLDQMDDLQEQEAGDLKNIGQFCYISSWTDATKEIIPMWDKYASLTAGIRIGLKANPFKLYKSNAHEILKYLTTSGGEFTFPEYSYIDIADMLSKGFLSRDFCIDTLLHQVEYTDDKNLLYPKLYKENPNTNTFSLFPPKLGIHKNTYWDFQKEWRYRFFAIPIDSNPLVIKTSDKLALSSQKIRDGIAIQPFSYYDLMLDEEHFKNMTITLCPQISAENKAIVESLVATYNPTATISDSKLLNLI